MLQWYESPHLHIAACWRAELTGHHAGFLPGISGGLQSLLLDPNTLSSLYGAMGTTSGAFLALSQLPGINMDAVQVRLCLVQRSGRCLCNDHGGAPDSPDRNQHERILSLATLCPALGLQAPLSSLPSAHICRRKVKRRLAPRVGVACAAAGRNDAGAGGCTKVRCSKRCHLGSLTERSPPVRPHLGSMCSSQLCKVLTIVASDGMIGLWMFQTVQVRSGLGLWVTRNQRAKATMSSTTAHVDGCMK